MGKISRWIKYRGGKYRAGKDRGGDLKVRRPLGKDRGESTGYGCLGKTVLFVLPPIVYHKCVAKNWKSGFCYHIIIALSRYRVFLLKKYNKI